MRASWLTVPIVAAALSVAAGAALAIDPPAPHIHGRGCGHFYYDGAWQGFPRDHAHADGCGHFFHGEAWSPFPEGHRHGPRCGHYLVEGGWSVYPAGHVHGPDCGHAFFGGAWHPFEAGHVHGAGCGHVLVADCWVAPAAAAHVEAASAWPSATEVPGGAARTAPRAVELVAERFPELKEPRETLVAPRVSDEEVRAAERAEAERLERERLRLARAEREAYPEPAPAYEPQAPQTLGFSGWTPAPEVHVHYDGCGHHYWDGDWHEGPRPDHLHYDGCGHVQLGGVWVIASTLHVHHAGCGHYADDGYWDDAPACEPEVQVYAPYGGCGSTDLYRYPRYHTTYGPGRISAPGVRYYAPASGRYPAYTWYRSGAYRTGFAPAPGVTGGAGCRPSGPSWRAGGSGAQIRVSFGRR